MKFAAFELRIPLDSFFDKEANALQAHYIDPESLNKWSTAEIDVTIAPRVTVANWLYEEPLEVKTFTVPFWYWWKDGSDSEEPVECIPFEEPAESIPIGPTLH